MSDGKVKRPLKKADESVVNTDLQNVRVIGSKGVNDISPDVLEQLKLLQGGGQGLVPSTEVPVHPGDSVKPVGSGKKKARVTSTSIRDVVDQAPKVEVSVPKMSVPVVEDSLKMGTPSFAFPEPQQTAPQLVKSLPPVDHRAFTVPLPSKGVLYGGAYKSGLVEVRPMTTKEESILYSDGDTLVQLNKILNRCVQNPEMNLMDMLLQDRFALLIYLRSFSYGSEYDIPFKCSGCGYKKTITLDLMDELSIKTMDDDAEEPFEVDLPQSGHFIHFRLLRGKDEEIINKKAKRFMLKSMDDGDPSNIYRLALSIMGVDGVEMPNFEQRVAFVENLIPIDSNVLRLAVEKVEGKIDTTVYHECESCGLTNEFGMPFTAEFFRPSRT